MRLLPHPNQFCRLEYAMIELMKAGAFTEQGVINRIIKMQGNLLVVCQYELC